jgi:hypothetical protein
MYLTNRPVLPESEQGQQLFEYLDPAGEVAPIGSEDVNEIFTENQWSAIQELARRLEKHRPPRRS